MKIARWWSVVVGAVLLAGCASDPELAHYEGGGRASPRGSLAARKELAKVAGALGVAGVVAGGAVADAAIEDALEQGTDGCEKKKRK